MKTMPLTLLVVTLAAAMVVAWGVLANEGCGEKSEKIFGNEDLQRTADVDQETGRRLQEELKVGYVDYYSAGCTEEELNKFFSAKNKGYGPKSKEETTNGSAR
jgi:hypothetical protein